MSRKTLRQKACAFIHTRVDILDISYLRPVPPDTVLKITADLPKLLQMIRMSHTFPYRKPLLGRREILPTGRPDLPRIFPVSS